MPELTPPKAEQVQSYYARDPVSTNSWSPEPSLDVVMASLQDLNDRLKALEPSKPEEPRAEEPIPAEAEEVKPMQE